MILPELVLVAILITETDLLFFVNSAWTYDDILLYCFGLQWYSI
jgi:hypothetical protein